MRNKNVKIGRPKGSNKWNQKQVSVNIKIPQVWRDAITKLAEANERTFAAEIRICIKNAFHFKRG